MNSHPPYFLTSDKSTLRSFKENGIEIFEISKISSFENFFNDNHINQYQEVILITYGDALSLQRAIPFENKVREIGGIPRTKIIDFHSGARLSRASSPEECIKIVSSMGSRQRFAPHFNPLTMDVEEVALKYCPDAVGLPMLYQTGVHFLYGKPGSMKSWFSQQFLAIHDVRYIDLENIYPILKKRLGLLGINPEKGQVFDKPEDSHALKSRIQEYVITKPEIVVFDSLSKVLSLIGAKQDSNDEVNAFFTEYVDPLRDAGICVVIIDHLPKDGNSDDFPIGAQAKKQNAEVMFLFKRGKDGTGADIYVAKDREYALESRCEPSGDLFYYGHLELVEDDNLLKVQVHPELSLVLDGETIPASKAKLWFQIEDLILTKVTVSKSDVRRSVTGKSGRIDDALSELVEKGYLLMVKVGSANMYSSLKKITR